MPSMEQPISKDELAKLAGAYFLRARPEDVPAKLWLDCYWAAEQVYLRATFDTKLCNAKLVRLKALAQGLTAAYGIGVVAVAYPDDADWDEVEARADALNAVR